MPESTKPTAEVKEPLVRLQEGFAAKEKLEKELDEAMELLYQKGIEAARSAFERLFPELTFPEVKSDGAIPHTKDNLRLDFDRSDDLSLEMEQTVDPETGISFTGFGHGKPVQSVVMQIRVPLSQLNDAGIEKLT